ncbi:MAG TPA: hypothetical protein VGD40_19060 [Chryseosolibacter sp.]
MFVPFETLPPTARLWIFQAEQKFSADEITIIAQHLQLFTNEWAAHGQPLRASYQIREDRFIVLAVDEQVYQASGCSIDGSTRTIKELATILRQDLFRRDLVWFQLGDEVEAVRLSDLKSLYKAGKWNENTLTFNTLVADKNQLANDWLLPAKDTWLKRYIVKEEVPH